MNPALITSSGTCSMMTARVHQHVARKAATPFSASILCLKLYIRALAFKMSQASSPCRHPHQSQAVSVNTCLAFDMLDAWCSRQGSVEWKPWRRERGRWPSLQHLCIPGQAARTVKGMTAVMIPDPIDRCNTLAGLSCHCYAHQAVITSEPHGTCSGSD